MIMAAAQEGSPDFAGSHSPSASQFGGIEPQSSISNYEKQRQHPQQQEHVSDGSPLRQSPVNGHGASPTDDADDNENDQHSQPEHTNSQPSLPRSSQHSQQLQQSQASSQRSMFMCAIDSVDTLLSVLSTLLLDKQAYTTMTLLTAGLKFTVVKSQSVCAKAYIKAQCFSLFRLHRDAHHYSCDIDISVLLQCLQVFGKEFAASTHVVMEIQASGSPLKLTLEDEGVITECMVPTIDSGSNPDQLSVADDFDFKSSPQVAGTDIESHHLRMCFSELDISGVSSVLIRMAPEHPRLAFTVSGDGLDVRIEFPDASAVSTSQDVLQGFQCQEDVQHSYSLSLVKPCLRALARATVTKLKVNAAGLLSLQHSISVHHGQKELVNWVEFVVVPLEEQTL